MPIGVNQYPTLSPEQANGYQYGLMQAIERQLKASQSRNYNANSQAQELKNPYVADHEKAALLKENLFNQFYPADEQSLINSRNASTKGTNLDSSLKELKLKYPGLGENGVIGSIAEMQLAADRPDLYKNLQQKMLESGATKSGEQPFNPMSILARNINAEISGKESLAAYRGMGGSRGGGVSMQQQTMLLDRVKQDNPNFTSEQIYEAAGNLADGKTTLNDGTKFNVNPLTLKTADLVASQGTPAAIRTQGLRANQAEAELQVLSKRAQEDMKPYAETYSGYSPKQIMDTFKNDKESQIRLGNFVASQAAQYEIAQIRNRIAGGEPGITATTELMGRSGQIIKTMFPRLSATAREQASKQLDGYLKEALNARNEYGSHFSKINGGNESEKHEEITMDMIEHTAKKRGMTVEAVMKKLKEQGRM